jgi:hypothetical protein
MVGGGDFELWISLPPFFKEAPSPNLQKPVCVSHSWLVCINMCVREYHLLKRGACVNTRTGIYSVASEAS